MLFHSFYALSSVRSCKKSALDTQGIGCYIKTMTSRSPLHNTPFCFSCLLTRAFGGEMRKKGAPCQLGPCGTPNAQVQGTTRLNHCSRMLLRDAVRTSRNAFAARARVELNSVRRRVAVRAVFPVCSLSLSLSQSTSACPPH